MITSMQLWIMMWITTGVWKNRKLYIDRQKDIFPTERDLNNDIIAPVFPFLMVQYSLKKRLKVFSEEGAVAVIQCF